MLPTITNTLSWLDALIVPLYIALLYAMHELLHILPLAVAGVDYSVELNPRDEPLWYGLLFGQAVGVQMKTTPRMIQVSALMPLTLSVPAIGYWGYLLSQPTVTASSLLYTALWIIVFLPSVIDLKEVADARTA